MDKRVVLGMSGGTDSSMAAVLLQEAGYEVTGVTFRFFEKEGYTAYLQDAAEVAARLGICHEVHDFRELFHEKIVTYFIEEYMQGHTPVPCVLCNNYLKWPLLAEIADRKGIHSIATGHYAHVEKEGELYYISPGADPDKDQSFFLWGLEQNVLSRILLPLGNYTKPHIRELAASKGFQKVAKKKDSIGVCFCPGDYRSFLRKKSVSPILPGFFRDSEGKILGKHEGFPFYTVGQRRGLGINFQSPTFVKEIIPSRNEVILSSIHELYHTTMFLKDWKLTPSLKVLPHDFSIICKIRYRKQATPCNLDICPDGTLRVSLGEFLHAISPGQAAAFYLGDKVIGGGIICGKI